MKLKEIFYKITSKLKKNKKTKVNEMIFDTVLIKIKLNNNEIQSIPLKINFTNYKFINEYAPPPPPNPSKYASISLNNDLFFTISNPIFSEKNNRAKFDIYIQGNIGDNISYDIDTNYGYSIKGKRIIDETGISKIKIYLSKNIIKGCSLLKNQQGILNYNYDEWVSDNYDKDLGPNDESCFPYGGVTKNKFLTKADGLKIARYTAGLESLSKEELLIADTNNSKSVDIGDALNIFRILSELPNPSSE